jgi:hypothetical protein
LDACDLARDVHGINRELATTISSWHSRDKGQTLEVPGDRLPLSFGVERDGRNHREKAAGVSRPTLDNRLAAAASENLGLHGLS